MSFAASSSSTSSLDATGTVSSCWWQDAFVPVLLLLVAHLALGFASEMFHHNGTHVGLRE
eukprot:CAMPEP_0178766452 /NCGR_PEP_ID=MMETSP0744-20121128/19072_1 /TAXON_ID=913974 /ORGANISM="Nitzschia punctata, Strain CCMP561" /LENGTH=59 /DNA_ID=CAMNT_0020422175 /DNA_START=191 /DNA_END=370 /DNA_ORIENTATION=-